MLIRWVIGFLGLATLAYGEEKSASWTQWRQDHEHVY